jgi:uncharacterized protein YrrD
MKKSRDIVGLPVIELREGKSLGKVHSLVVNPDSRRVEALEVGERSLLKTKTELVPFSQIRSFGSDAITLQDHEVVQEAEETPELASLLERKLIGSRVVTVDGTLVGVVEYFTFAIENGLLTDLYVAFEKTRGHLLVPISVVASFGRDFIIINENYGAEVKNVDAPTVERTGRQLVHSLEVRAIEFALSREAGQDVLDDNGEAVIRKGEKLTSDTIDLARQKNRLTQVLLTAGVGELLDGVDFTREKLDSGSRKLLETWNTLRGRSQEWLARKIDEDRPSPTGELRELWFQLQGKLAQGGRELENSTKDKIRDYVQGKTLAHPVYDKDGQLIAGRGEMTTPDMTARAEQSGRLPQLFLSTAASDVQLALDPIKQQIKDVLGDWDKKE